MSTRSQNASIANYDHLHVAIASYIVAYTRACMALHIKTALCSI